MLLINRRSFLTLGLFLVLIISSVHSQEYGIFGKVVDLNNQPISFANVLLVNSEDASFVAGTSTDENGSFSLIPIESGSYRITISFIGYTSFEQELSLNKDTEFGTIVLEESSEALDEISIIAKKPTITKKPDRLIFNIESTALTEGSTLQVLKSTPGIIVSDGGVNIKNSAATIYINGKRVQLSSNELIQLLESAPANAIKSVEVITNPPANYDADSGGVINIVMSKNLISGYRGNVYGNYTQGVYPRYNIGTSHFFKNDKVNFNVNYNYTNQKLNRDNLSTVNYLDESNEIEEIWTSNINRTTWSETHNLNLNFDYDIDDRNVLSLSATGLYTPYFKYNVYNNTDITDPNDEFLSRFTADNNSNDDKLNIGTDLDYQHEFKNGASLSFNSHYTRYDYQRDQNVFSEFFDDDNIFESDSEFNTLANQETDIVTAKLDYNMQLDEDTAALDVGAKFSNVQTDSDITKVDIINDQPVLDPLNSDIYLYDEKVYAAYANYSKTWESWDLNIGLRVEQTNIEGESVSLNQTNTQDYLEWFPNISLSHEVSDNLSLYTTYKRSITRPNYTNLNPFRFFLNENTVVVGNPTLQPTFIDHVKIGSNFLEYFTVEAYYMNYNGAINEIPRQNNETNIIAYVPVNIDTTIDYGIDLIVDFYVNDWWSIYALTSFYNKIEENQFGDDFVSLSQWANYSWIKNSFTLLEDNSLNIDFDVIYTSKYLESLALFDPLVFSTLAVSKSIMKKRANVSLIIEDLFNAQDPTTNVSYLNQSSSNFTDRDNRYIKLSFRYNFGNTKLTTNERSSDVDERNRIVEEEN